ncbi:A disintegrin and metalloproteinase with thrombospondin motifs 17-like [Branchiostoma floridae x Branchiostoma belcheri]
MAAVQQQPVPRVLALLLAGLFFLALASGARHNIQVVFPRRVQREQAGAPGRGARGRAARDAEGTSGGGDPQDFVFYRMDAFGKTLLLRLTPNKEFLSRSFQTMTLGGDGRVVDLSGSTGACFYSGTVESFERSSVVLSTCSGLMGLIKVNNEQMLIEPLSQRRRYFGGRPHRVYRRELPQASVTQFCGTETDDRGSESDEPGSRKTKRSAVNNIDARQRTVEALVVLDKSIVKHHGRALVKTYALTVMSMVNSVISLPSMGHNINIAVTKLVILEEDQVGLKLAHHADSALHNFCQWQREKLPYVSAVDTDTNEVIGHRDRPSRHDAAILLTRKDICKDRDEPCGTLGMAFISGLCDPNRMCSVNEDNGLTLAFTVAHELGHNLGMNHDGRENRCVSRPDLSIQYIMSSSWLRRTGKVNLQWSRCSRARVENFLRSKQSQCLLDTKSEANVNLQYREELPGELYTAQQQCVFNFGKNASVCPYPEKKNRLCESLWCIEPGKDECVTKEFAAVDGTECGNDKWCKAGRCEYNKDPVHGGWGNWTRWSGCSRTCGMGVRFAARKCDNPYPEYDGRYCSGDRIKYDVCNTQPCPEGSPTFRSEQCTSYRHQHARANKTQSSLWYPVYSEESPCSLLCRPVSGRRRTVWTLSDRVIDGTPCSPGKRALCVDGQCKRVGCDDVIGSDAEEDRCGVCRGNGTTCHLVRGMYQHQHGTGYEEIVVIPKGARKIRVMEARPMRSYLAMRDSASKRYVNGGRRIELPGIFKMAGTKVQYTRKDLWETFTAEGPTNNSLQFLILQQDPVVGVVFEYAVDLENASHEESPTVNNYKITNVVDSFREDVPTYGWVPDGWGECDAVCGGGVRRGRNRCMQLVIQNRSLTFVEDEPCRNLARPHQKEEKCNNAPCETKWRTAGWLPCPVTCGEGTQRRVVACTQELPNGTLRATETCAGSRPPSEKPCRLKSCPLVASGWKESSWGECSVTCGGGIQSRLVRCVGRASDGSERYVGEAQCQEEKPAETKECGNRSCEDAYEWRTDAWSACSASCGLGVQLRNASCVDPLENDTDTAVPEQLCFAPKPDVIRNCTFGACPIKKWEVSAWAGCSVSCGQGMQSRDVTCMTSYTNGTVLTGDDLCDAPKPPPVRSCGFEPCPISESWDATTWHACSVTCGQGIRSRRVRCKVTYPNGTMLYAPDVRCNDTEKPRTLKPCFGMECAAKPIEIVWSKCSSKCGPGERTRRVKCHQEDALCKVKYRAVRRVSCYGSKCSGVWKTGPWSKCSVTCGYGLQHRSTRCKTDRTDRTWFHNCNKHDRPDSTRSCSAGSCVNAFDFHVFPLQPPKVKEPRRCTRDRANPRICQVVKTRGRLCRHTHWAKNCCRTCGYYEVV